MVAAMLPLWFHEIATLTTLGLAAGWLVVHWLRVAKPRGGQLGCARCDHNALAPPGPAAGVRSKQLRVIS